MGKETDNLQKAKSYHGGSFLESVLKETCGRLGNQPIDNLYKACLFGGDNGVRLMLSYDRRCLDLWRKGDLRKAGHLLEVWASTCVLVFLQRQEDQDAVLRDTARGFSMLFRSDLRSLETELLHYRQARIAEQARHSEKGAVTDLKNPITGTLKDIADSRGILRFSRDILYLRTLRALGDKGVPNFELLPVPWSTLREVLEAKPNLQLDITIFTDINNGWNVQEILISSLDVAKRTFAQLGV